MDMSMFYPELIIQTAQKNLPYILKEEPENGVPLNYMDDKGRYVFEYKDGTILEASMRKSFDENLEDHKRIMGSGWTGGCDN